MTGFRWDRKAFELGAERFRALSVDSDGYLPTMATHVSSWENSAGLLGAVLAPNHDHMAVELHLSAACTPEMVKQIATNIDEVYKKYDAAEDASRVSIEGVWDDLDFNLPKDGDANLERFGKADYDFGSGFPPHTDPESGDFTIVEIVNKILGWPSSGALPPGELKNEVLQLLWDGLLKEFYAMADWLAEGLTGDWAHMHRAGDAMCKIADYWRELSRLTVQAGGTLFLGWDGTASESAERFVEKVGDLFWSAPAYIELCGEAYKTHAHGCHLLFHEIYTLLTEALDIASSVFAILDAADTPGTSLEYLHSCVTYALDTLGVLFETLSKVVGKVLLVARIIEAVVGLVMASSTFLTNYNNEMRANLKF